MATIVANSPAHATISYDPNARPSQLGDPADAVIVIGRVIGLSDVVKASEEDVAWLYRATPES